MRLTLAFAAALTASSASAQSLLDSVKAAPFASDKVAIVQGAAGRPFAVDEVAALVDAMPFSVDKVAVVEALRADITDRHNAHRLYSHFPFSSDRERVAQLLSEPVAAPRIEAFSSLGKCLDAPATLMGTQLTLRSCHGGASQSFTQDPNNGEIALTGSGLCLNIEGGIGHAGDRVILWPCTGGTRTYENQAWRYDGWNIIGLEGLCVDVSGGDGSDGSPIIVWPCHGQANQAWSRR